MSPAEVVSQVKTAIAAYPGTQFLYLHRAIVIANCLGWDFSDSYIRAQFQFERLVIGDEWNWPTWEFGVRWDDVNLSRLQQGRLSGCQLRDTVVLDPAMYEKALQVDPRSDEAVIEDFRQQILP